LLQENFQTPLAAASKGLLLNYERRKRKPACAAGN
jgi:hypothetical protein